MHHLNNVDSDFDVKGLVSNALSQRRGGDGGVNSPLIEGVDRRYGLEVELLSWGRDVWRVFAYGC